MRIMTSEFFVGVTSRHLFSLALFSRLLKIEESEVGSRSLFFGEEQFTVLSRWFSENTLGLIETLLHSSLLKVCILSF